MPATQRVFDHVLVVMLENEYRSYVMKNPYMRALAKQGIDLANHFGNMHPSQTNYVSTVAGELCNIGWDWPPYPPPLPQRTLADLIEEAPGRLRWKAYLDGYVKTLWRPDMQPGDFPVPFPVPDQLWATTPEPFRSIPQPYYPYAYFHNPFFLFERIMRNRVRWQRIEDEASFWRDLLAGDFPEFAWFSPNLWNDGHYLYGTAVEPGDRAPLVNQQADWLKSFFAALRFPGPASRLPPRTLVVVTYDEADFDADYDRHVGSTYDGPNQVYTVLLGDMIEPGIETEGSNHYSLLKTVEKNFGLPSLGKNDRDCNWWQFLWGRRFRWSPASETPLVDVAAVAAAALGRRLYVVLAGEDGTLRFRTFDGTRWSAERTIAGARARRIAMTALGDRLVLIGRDDDGGLSEWSFTPARGWSAAPQPLVPGAAGAFALAAVDFNHTAMLAYAQGEDLYSIALAASGWGEPVPVGHKTDGDVALAVLGPSLFLIYKAAGGDAMHVVSYNTADFNVLALPAENGGPDNNTCKERWSPSAYPVAYFWRGPARRTPDTDEPLLLPYRAGAPYATATLDGVIHLAHPRADAPQVMTETFSLSGVMTPVNPVAWVTEAKLKLTARRGGEHRSRFSIWRRFLDKQTASTTAAAPDPNRRPASNGFGTLAEAGWSIQHPIGKVRQAGGAFAMARLGERLMLLSQERKGGPLMLSVGDYAADEPRRRKWVVRKRVVHKQAERKRRK